MRKWQMPCARVVVVVLRSTERGTLLFDILKVVAIGISTILAEVNVLPRKLLVDTA